MEYLNYSAVYLYYLQLKMDVYLIYNDDKDLKKLGDANIKVSPFFHFVDDRTRRGIKDSWKIKGRFGTKLTPFAVVYEGEKPIKAFYSETEEDIVESLIKYLNGK